MIARSLCIVTALAACQQKHEPTCAEVGARVRTMFVGDDALAQDLERVFRDRCTQDAWPASVRSCIASTASVEEPRNCKAQLAPAQVTALDADLAAAEARAEGRVMPQACLDYEVQLTAALDCEAIAKPERERMAARFATAKHEWLQRTDKRSLAQTCSAAIAALRDATADCKPR